eukprot:3846670-Pyramimonas_sp.AAC.1
METPCFSRSSSIWSAAWCCSALANGPRELERTQSIMPPCCLLHPNESFKPNPIINAERFFDQ